MALPDSVLLKLAAEFRADNGDPLSPLRSVHTLPIRRDRWNAYAESFDDLIQEFASAVADREWRIGEFAAIRSWLARVTELRRQISSVLWALTPFEYFDEELAAQLMNWVDAAVLEVAGAVRERRDCDIRPLDADGVGGTWTLRDSEPDDFRIGPAFGLDFEPLNQELEFQAADVFSAFAYRNTELVDQVLPHLESLGVSAEAMANDMLVGVSVVGWIITSQDPIVAAVALDQLLASLLHPASPEVSEPVLGLFTDRENVTLQVRRKVAAALIVISQAHDLERRALALADAYKILAEGPIRHFGWALACLQTGSWSRVPMLAQVRDRLVASGGFAASIGDTCIITNLRNGQAHETLEWDGVEACYLANGDAIPLVTVLKAVAVGSSFDKGCEAALACYRALNVTPELTVVAGDTLRMPSRERALAHFGTNGLEVLWADFNSAAARVHLSCLTQENINPCFQALIVARQLLPRVTRFEVSVEGQGTAIAVDAEALDSTLRVWSEARGSFSKMPFAAFLPANLAARSLVEAQPLAVRSISWIAVDDLLSAVDGAVAILDAGAIELMSKRVHLVETALLECMPNVPDGLRTRPRAALDAARELQRALALLSPPTPLSQLDRLDSVSHLRRFWTRWGPVPRLPTVAEPSETSTEYEEQPELLNLPNHPYWQTL